MEPVTVRDAGGTHIDASYLQVVQGLEWVKDNFVAPAVVVMALGGEQEGFDETTAAVHKRFDTMHTSYHSLMWKRPMHMQHNTACTAICRLKSQFSQLTYTPARHHI